MILHKFSIFLTSINIPLKIIRKYSFHNHCALNNVVTQFMNSYFNLALKFILDKFSFSFHTCIAEDKSFIEVSK